MLLSAPAFSIELEPPFESELDICIGSVEKPSIAIDANGFYHIVYQEYIPEGDNISHYNIAYNSQNNGITTLVEGILYYDPETGEHTGFSTYNPDIAIGPDGTIYVVYVHDVYDGIDSIHMMVNNNGSWSDPYPIAEGDVDDPGISIDSHNAWHMVYEYYDGNYHIYYKNSSNDCYPILSGDAFNPDIAVSTLTGFHVAYQTSNDRIILLRGSNLLELQSIASEAGSYPSVSTDSDGSWHIVYRGYFQPYEDADATYIEYKDEYYMGSAISRGLRTYDETEFRYYGDSVGHAAIATADPNEILVVYERDYEDNPDRIQYTYRCLRDEPTVPGIGPGCRFCNAGNVGCYREIQDNENNTLVNECVNYGGIPYYATKYIPNGCNYYYFIGKCAWDEGLNGIFIWFVDDDHDHIPDSFTSIEHMSIDGPPDDCMITPQQDWMIYEYYPCTNVLSQIHMTSSTPGVPRVFMERVGEPPRYMLGENPDPSVLLPVCSSKFTEKDSMYSESISAEITFNGEASGGEIELDILGIQVLVETANGQNETQYVSSMTDSINANAICQQYGIAATRQNNGLILSNVLQEHVAVDIRDGGIYRVEEPYAFEATWTRDDVVLLRWENATSNYDSLYITNGYHSISCMLSGDTTSYVDSIGGGYESGYMLVAYKNGMASWHTMAEEIHLTCVEEDGGNQEESVIDGEQMICYPNPFNGRVTIAYYLGSNAEVSMAIYSIRGETIRVMPLGEMGSGWNIVEWDGRSNSGKNVSAGVYLVRIRRNDNISLMSKLLYLK